MARLLPIVFLAFCGSLFALVWIVLEINPDTASWYIFVGFLGLLFFAILCLLGLIFYFLRTRFYRRYSAKWYFYTSFKMAFFVALFALGIATLAIFQMISLFSVLLTILAVSLLAIWSFLGVRGKH